MAAVDEHEEERLAIPVLDSLADGDLDLLNWLLPWKCFVLDKRGRRFGAQASANKRNTPQQIPDWRVTLLNQRVPLADASVLELGCFEGIHTIALAAVARHVSACDSRIEHVVKTAVRCAMFQVKPTLFVWDVEKPVPDGQTAECDVLFHIGVLYHLLDPIRHLANVAGGVRRAILLDSHYARPEEVTEKYDVDGTAYDCKLFREGGREGAFSGMYPTSRWLLLADIMDALGKLGFPKVDLVQQRDERNGARALIIAER